MSTAMSVAGCLEPPADNRRSLAALIRSRAALSAAPSASSPTEGPSVEPDVLPLPSPPTTRTNSRAITIVARYARDDMTDPLQCVDNDPIVSDRRVTQIDLFPITARARSDASVLPPLFLPPHG